MMARVSIIGGFWPFAHHSALGMVGRVWHALLCRGDVEPAHIGLLFERLDLLGSLATSEVARRHGVVDVHTAYVFEVLSDRPPRFHRLDERPWSSVRRIVNYGALATGGDKSFARWVFQACLHAADRQWTYLWTSHLNGCCCQCCGRDLGKALCLPCGDDEAVEVGHCVSHLLTVVAHARWLQQGRTRAPATDAEVIATLGLRHDGACARVGWWVWGGPPLTAFAPTDAIEALERAGFLVG